MTSAELASAQRRAYRSADPHWWSNLAALYATREPPDLVRARHWYRRAARAIDVRACFEYGLMLILGEGGPKRPAQGRRLVEDAARGGQPDAVTVLAHAYRTGTYTFPKSARRARLYEAKRDRRMHAARCFARAHTKLEAEQPASARRLFRQGAALKDPDCALCLGYLHDMGLGGRHDVRQAEQWYRRAYAWGSKGCAANNLGLLAAEQGRISDARRWLQRALDAGDPDAGKALVNLAARTTSGASASRVVGTTGAGASCPMSHVSC